MQCLLSLKAMTDHDQRLYLDKALPQKNTRLYDTGIKYCGQNQLLRGIKNF